ncbi:hypothetical protein EV129_11451 [Rhizobium azibense]|uniref:Uncharacterized protein n=1 Tax=Rhizobium azibense TaxID=1136135 RepID=A0A4R3RE54_9HYPH|nr:hypothetical protein EV129_11451 [Rhizobium azibense]
MAAATVAAHRLPGDAGAFQKKCESVSKKLRLPSPGGGTEFFKALTLLCLMALDHLMGRVSLTLQFDRRVGKIATGRLPVETLGSPLNPGLELRARVAGMHRLEFTPYCLGLFAGATQRLANELVLRAEMPVKRHLVGERRICNRIDANAAYAMFAEKLGSRRDDAFPRGDFLVCQHAWDFMRSFGFFYGRSP